MVKARMYEKNLERIKGHSNYYWQNHGPSFGFTKEKLSNIITDSGAERGPVDFAARVFGVVVCDFGNFLFSFTH